MGCFANFFRFIYAFLALIAIFFLILILTLPTYWSYCGDPKCDLTFHMNPSHVFCVHNSKFLCPPEYRTSNPHRVIWILYIVIIPIILVCAILNFVTAILCCPFGPKGCHNGHGDLLLHMLCVHFLVVPYLQHEKGFLRWRPEQTRPHGLHCHHRIHPSRQHDRPFVVRQFLEQALPLGG